MRSFLAAISARIAQLPLWGICFFTSSFFLLATQLRVLNYACGNDPMLYIRAARTLLQPSLYGVEAVREALTFVAPGYPILLAATIALFGDLAPYWLNTILLIALTPIMWFVFQRLMGGERAALLAILGVWIIVFRGHPLHAPYVLYPFREVARLIFVFAAFGVLVWAFRKETGVRVKGVSAAVLFVAACAVREPSALFLPGVILGMAVFPVARQNRWQAIQGFIIPWLGIGLIGVMVMLRHDLLTITQFSVLPYLRNHEVAWSRMEQMWVWFPSRMTWIGLILVLGGVIRAALSSRVLLAWLFLPAAFLFIFYAYVHMHVRYFLTTIILLAPFAGYGLDGLAVIIERRAVPFINTKVLRPVLTVSLYIALCVGLVDTYRRTRMWGPGLDAAQVRHWQQLVAELEPSASGRVTVAVEQRSRYLEDLLLSYTDVQLLDPRDVLTWPDPVLPSHYFKPLNRRALWDTPQWLMHKQIYGHRLIADVLNLTPVTEELVAEHWIGGGEYRHMRITKWLPGPHEQEVNIGLRNEVVLWIDWGASSSTEQAKHLTLQEAGSGRIISEWVVDGIGYQPVYTKVTGQSVDAARLRSDADFPVPAQPVTYVVGPGEEYVIHLSRHRPISANPIFPSWSRGRREVRINQPGFPADRPFPLVLPPLHGAGSEVGWKIAIWFHHGRRDPGVNLQIALPSQPLLDIELDAGANPVYFIAAPGSVVELIWRNLSDSPSRNRLHIDAIGFQLHHLVEKQE